MTTMRLLAVLGICGILCGCAGPAGMFGQMEGGSVMPIYVEPGFDRQLSVEKGEIETDPETGLKCAKVWVKNVDDRPLTIVYWYTWYDTNGNITNRSGFMQGRLDSGITKPILLATTNKESMRYAITIHAR